MGVSTQKLVMPTRDNLEVFDRLLHAAGGLVDMKRQVDRVEQEVRTLRAQKEGFVPPLGASGSRQVDDKVVERNCAET
jgi:DNA methyltransferase 1-associated protein 1